MEINSPTKEPAKTLEERDPLYDFTVALGALTSTLSENQIKCLHYTFERFADATFDRWLEKRNAGLLDMNETV